MPDVVKALLGSAGTPIGHPRVISGYISLNQPAPTTFNDLVFVIAEDHSEDRPYGPMAFPAIHGAALPAQGAACVFSMDQNNTPTLVWWAGTYDATQAVQPGDIIASAAATRAGCLLCDGTSYLRTAQPALFAALGGASSPYGLPDGTHFNVPDGRGRVLLGAGTGTATGAAAHALGSTPTSGAGGEETHTLTITEMPSHSHSTTREIGFTQGNGAFHASEWLSDTSRQDTFSTGNTGSGNAHNIMQPSVAINYFIKT